MLKSLTTRTCPECGCEEIIQESVQAEMDNKRILTHTNGSRWEARVFLCGLRVEYVPNFEKDVIAINTCRRSAANLEKLEKKKANIKAIEDFTKSLNDETGVSARILEVLNAIKP